MDGHHVGFLPVEIETMSFELAKGEQALVRLRRIEWRMVRDEVQRSTSPINTTAKIPIGPVSILGAKYEQFVKDLREFSE